MVSVVKILVCANISTHTQTAHIMQLSGPHMEQICWQRGPYPTNGIALSQVICSLGSYNRNDMQILLPLPLSLDLFFRPLPPLSLKEIIIFAPLTWSQERRVIERRKNGGAPWQRPIHHPSAITRTDGLHELCSNFINISLRQHS